jgi:hypothetical protein
MLSIAGVLAMTLGLALFTLFTLFHVAVSLVGIAAGFVVAYRFLTNQRLDRWNALFLTTTIATSASGFGFPYTRFLPSHALGLVSLAVLAVPLYAWYWRNIAQAWRPTYVVTAILAQYFNVFVLVAQSFAKLPVLKALAPTQTETPFVLTQLLVLATFVVLGALAVLRFRGNAVGKPQVERPDLSRRSFAADGSSPAHQSLSI